MEMDALTLKKLTPLFPSSQVQEVNWVNWEHLKGLELADADFGTPARIDCIIGAEIYGRLLTGKIRQGRPGEPTAQETVFGWVLSGFTSHGPQAPLDDSWTRTFHVCVDQSLHTALRNFWEIEELPARRIRSPEDERCEEHFESTYRRNEHGNFVVRLPFISDLAELGNSKSIATTRWLQTEARLSRRPEEEALYLEFMLEYLALGHMEPVNEEAEPARVYYIPHHAVMRIQGEKKKIRVMFNASQETSSGTSLNDCLSSGPKEQEDLWIIIIRWRFFFLAFVADIVKMFRNILVDRRDCDLLRILWRMSPKHELSTFRLLTVTYGTTSAPYQAIKTLLKLAQIYEQKYPLAATLIKKRKYVDDFLAGADTLEETKALQDQLIGLLSEAGFTLGKLAANDAALLVEPREDQAIPLELKLDECVSTLGLRWLPRTDSFSFKINKVKPATQVTKRAVLAEIAKLFDPLGWLGPVVIRAKVLMQRLWILGDGWDEPLSKETKNSWCKFLEELPDLEKIQIPRWFGTFSYSKIQLHGFSDASERAYAAVVYLVTRQEATWSTNLVLAKTKVTPIKTLSMPRLELCGTHLLAKLLRELNAIGIPCQEVYCWTNAKIVPSWLADHPSRWTTFIATWTSSIFSLLPGVPWHHVKSADNLADLATRGLSPAELCDSRLWWYAPDWLGHGLTPEQSVTIATDGELPERRVSQRATFTAQKIPEEITERFSSYQRLIRTM